MGFLLSSTPLTSQLPIPIKKSQTTPATWNNRETNAHHTSYFSSQQKLPIIIIIMTRVDGLLRGASAPRDKERQQESTIDTSKGRETSSILGLLVERDKDQPLLHRTKE